MSSIIPGGKLDSLAEQKSALATSLIQGVTVESFINEDDGLFGFHFNCQLNPTMWNSMSPGDQQKWGDSSLRSSHATLAYIDTPPTEFPRSWDTSAQRLMGTKEQPVWQYTVEYRIPEHFENDLPGLEAMVTAITNQFQQRVNDQATLSVFTPKGLLGKSD